HPEDVQPDVRATVMPLSTSSSADTVSFSTTVPRDVCDVLTWRIRYTTSSGQPTSRDVQFHPDHDVDGIPDTQDRCPGPAAGAAVNGDGCSMAQLGPCGGADAGPRPFHALFVFTVDHGPSAGLVIQGLLTADIDPATGVLAGTLTPGVNPRTGQRYRSVSFSWDGDSLVPNAGVSELQVRGQ